ncbi:unnamed protein product [Symbiodinium sp. CCMP2592]|nr:unnamed protein product [Symbiodinium sp. CCMP2592]
MRDDSLGKDCTPSQANFAIFCDVRCVRDAVVRGDRTILRNLERATGITNRNMDKLAKWLANTQKADVGWLGDKVDHQTEVTNQKQFNELKHMVGGDKKLYTLLERPAADPQDLIRAARCCKALRRAPPSEGPPLWLPEVCRRWCLLNRRCQQ